MAAHTENGKGKGSI